MNQTFLVGIFFNSLVSMSVAVVAFLFTIFLFRRWNRLDITRRAYTWFWFFTMLVWIMVAIRYFFISIGYAGLGIYIGDIAIEGAIFFTGPPLLYYLSLRLFKQKWVASILSILSTILAFIALYFVLLPEGISEIRITDFSADVSINFVSLGIFASQIILIIGLILYDIWTYLFRRETNNINDSLYQFLYSIPLLIYVGLGAIDQSKIIIDWPLVVFRILYASSFLFAYLIILEEDLQNEQYFLESNTTI